MGTTIKILPGERLVLATVFGRIGRDDLLRMIDEVYDHPDFGPGFDQLCDFGDAGVDLSGWSGRQLTEMIRSRGEGNAEILRGGRLALVSRRLHVYGLMRMLKMVASGWPLETRVFRRREDAEAWLSKAPVVADR